MTDFKEWLSIVKKFNATPKFAATPTDAYFFIGEDNEVIAIFHDERHTLYGIEFPGEALGIQGVLEHTWLMTNSVPKVLEGMREYAKLSKHSCLMGELKPIFSDVSWEEWCSSEYMAKEYYARQERLRRRRM